MAEYASNGKGNTALALGGSALGLSALTGMGGLAGLFGGAVEDRHITRHEMDLLREIIDGKQANAILVAQTDVDKKIVDVYNALAKQDKDIREKMEANYKEQQQINMQQAVYNGTNNATLACMQNQVAQLMSLTALHIPAAKVCPEPMAKYNSWTAPTT